MAEHPLDVATGDEGEFAVPRVFDALTSLTEALKALPQEEQSEQLFVQALDEQPLDLSKMVGVLLERDLPLPVGLVQMTIGRWFEDGPQVWTWISDWCTSSMLVSDEDLWPLARVIWSAFDRLAGIPEPCTPHDVADALTALAEELERLGELDAAMSCAFSGLNFVGESTDAAAVPIANVALRLATATGDRDRAVFAQLRRALALLPSWASDERVRRPAAEAAESVVSHLGDSDSVASLTGYLERELAQIPELRALALAVAATHPEDAPGPTAELAPFALMTQRCWQLPREQVGEIPGVLQPWMEFENVRLALHDRTRDVAAEASWDTWSIDHPAFRRSVPQGNSILREVDLDELLLILHHESTHVLSMLSGVGFVAIALRAAVLDAELDLWTIGRQPTWHEIETELWASPRPGAIQALAQGEQLLELRRKLQILQGVWGPILEGVAIFGELCADPREPDEQASHVANLVANLVDIDLAGEAERSGVAASDVQRESNETAEARYGQALDRTGALRLRTYLDRHHEKYLAGYLAARSVVSAWRARAEEDLSGVAAYRILLHALRALTEPAVPALDGPLEGFEARALRGMLDWLRSVANLSAEQLAELAPNRAVLRRVDGELTTVAPTEPEERGDDVVSRRFAEARRALEGDAANASRVLDVDEEVSDVLGQVARSLALGTTEPSLFAEAFIEYAITAPALMPIAQTDAPFWLNQPTNALICITRTTEQDYQHGESSYQVLHIPLDAESFDLLKGETERSADARLTVTRVADLVDRYREETGRIPGVNYVVLSFRDWMKVSPRGWLFTKSDPPDEVQALAERRFRPNPVVGLERRLGEAYGAPSARRLEGWLDASDRWTADGVEYPLEPWARHVRRLAAEVTAGEGDSAAKANRALLAWTLGDEERSEMLADRGLSDLYDVSADAMRNLVRVLQASGNRPAHDAWMDENAEDIAATLGPLMRCSATGWDVTPPKEMTTQ